jgi:hypothetical protein
VTGSCCGVEAKPIASAGTGATVGDGHQCRSASKAIARKAESRPSLVRRVPGEETIAGWISQARSLPRAVEY